MSVQPGMPEHKGLADRIKTLEAKVARLSRARTMQSTSLDGGTFRVKNGGTIEILDGSGNVIHTFDINGMTVFEADGSTLMQLDGTGITLNDGSGTKLIDLTTSGLRAFEADGSTLLVLDGSKLRFNRSDGSRQLEITPAGGLKFYQADGTTVITTLDGSGLQVGTDVVIDSTGLHVGGGLVQSIWFSADRSFQTNNSLSTSFSTIATINVNPPSWVEVLAIEATGNGSMSNTSGSTQNLQLRVTIEGETPATRSNSVEHNTTRTHSAIASETVTLSPAGQDLDITLEARVNSGANSTNALSLNVSAFGVRSAFS